MVLLLAVMFSLIDVNSASNFSNLVFNPTTKSSKSSISNGSSPLIILILSTLVSITVYNYYYVSYMHKTTEYGTSYFVLQALPSIMLLDIYAIKHITSAGISK